MSATVSLEVPREIVHATRLTPLELKRELALHLFAQGRLSFGKAREMAEMTVGDFQLWLGSRRIPIHYGVEDYQADLLALRELPGARSPL